MRAFDDGRISPEGVKYGCLLAAQRNNNNLNNNGHQPAIAGKGTR
jgi:hypothetical protein